MIRTVVCLIFALLFVRDDNAQTIAMTGTVMWVSCWTDATNKIEVEVTAQHVTPRGPSKAREASFAHIRPHHVAVLQKWLSNKPGWRPAVESDAYIGSTKEGREFLKGEIQSMSNHPYYVVDDFNGDGYQDFAVILIRKAGRSYKHAVAVFNGPFKDT